MTSKLAHLQFLLLLMLFFLSNSSLSQSDEFIFKGFRNHAINMSLNGVSVIESNGVLKLTNDTPRLLGHAFYKDEILFKNSSNGKVFSFSTAFAFGIVPEIERLGGHGMAFVISSTKELKGALPSQYLGIVNSFDNGNFSHHLFAVEFDTVRDLELNDISDNHVGIDLNSVISNASANASYFDQDGLTEHDISLKSGKIIQAWVDYDSIGNELNVTLSLSSQKPRSSILSFRVDLSPFFEDYMYVGFSGSTGLLSASHYVFGWSFKINGFAESLDLSSLPSLPSRRQPKPVGLILGSTMFAAALMVVAVLLAFYIVKKIKNREVIEDWEHEIGPHRFRYKELKLATKDFSEKELLGFGGFGRVYKGTLRNTDTQVAVKRISNESRQGFREFASEIGSIGRLRHRNLVQLLGWCQKGGDLLLVYDFMPNGSLDKYLYDKPKMILTWAQRFKIIKDIASGLLYLHEEWEKTVIHRDIKAANVLLDMELNGKLGDFGLAKLHEHGTNPSTTRVVGTLGYLAPELTKTGKPTTSTDVFAFGALLLEVVCGRRPIEPKASVEELVLVDWVWNNWKNGAMFEAVDQRLNGEYDELEAVMVLKLGLMCSSNSTARRPNMREVVRYLEGDNSLPDTMIAPDEYERKDSKGSDFEDFVHSYSSSSCPQKTGIWSSSTCYDRNVDLEATTMTLLTMSDQGEGR